MIRNRILSLLVCAALLACLLAGCSTSSGTDGGEAASSSSSAASSESIPSSTTQANTGKLTPNLDESDNSLFSPAASAPVQKNPHFCSHILPFHCTLKFRCAIIVSIREGPPLRAAKKRGY